MVVHIYGLPTDMAPLRRNCREAWPGVIEDAAETHGQTWPTSLVAASAI